MENLPEIQADYDLKDLRQKFKDYINSIRNTPIEAYEILLYSATARFKTNNDKLD